MTVLFDGAREISDSITVQKQCSPGFYKLRLKFLQPVNFVNFLVYCDGKEIGANVAYYTKKKEHKEAEYEYDLLISNKGRSLFTIRLTGPYHEKDNASKSLVITSMTMEKVRIKNGFYFPEDFPGRVYLDLWGWTSVAWHGFCPWFKVGMDYFKKRAVVEPWKWGANYTQTHTYAYKDEHRRFIEYLHNHDFLVDEHGFPPQRRTQLKDGRMQVFRPHVSGSRLLPKSQEAKWPTQYVAKNTLDFVNRWAGRFSNALKYGWTGAIDGFETEEYAAGRSGTGVFSCKENLIKLNHAIWQYNQGAYAASCGHPPARDKDYYRWLHEGFHGPNFIHVAMDAGSGWKSCCGGYDDHLPHGLFNKCMNFHNDYNHIFVGYQADSRLYTTNNCGGLTSPDWIMKQCYDFFRARAKDASHIHESTIFWLGESSRLLPEEIKEYVYIVSQDPLKSAVTTNLGNTGLDGKKYWLKDALKDYFGGDKKTLPSDLVLRQRDEELASTSIIQNNWLRLYRRRFGDSGILKYDPEGTAHYDSNSLSSVLSNDFISTKQGFSQTVLKANNIVVKDSMPHKKELRLGPGIYTLHIDLEEEAYRMVNVLLNNRIVGQFGQDNKSIPVYIPEEGLYELCFALDKTIDIKDYKNKITIQDATLTYDNSIVDVPIYHAEGELEKERDISRRNGKKEYFLDIEKDSDQRFPKRIGHGLFEIINWDIPLKPDCYMLAIKANKINKAQATLSIGLDRERFSTGNLGMLRSGVERYKDYPPETRDFQVPAGYSRIGRFKLYNDERIYLIPFNVYDEMKHRIEIVNTDTPVEINEIKLYKMPIGHNYRLKGGAKAVLEETIPLGKAGHEKRTYEIINDRPSLRIKIERDVKGSAPVTILDRRNFNRIITDNSRANPGRFILTGSNSTLPDLGIILQKKGFIRKVRWDKERIQFESSILKGKDEIVIDVVVLTGQDTGKDIKTLSKDLFLTERAVKISGKEKPFKISNKLSLPGVETIKIQNPQQGPYLVCENGWWMVRGAQPVFSEIEETRYLKAFRRWIEENKKKDKNKNKVEHFPYHQYTASSLPAKKTDFDYLKLYFNKKDVLVQPYGFIDGVVKPGYGCQYLMAISEILENEKGAACKIKVFNTTAYIFAPRIEFKHNFCKALLNGKEWHYLDGKIVFLPQSKGEYHVEVIYGKRQTPSLTRCAASISETIYSQNELRLKLDLPEYVQKIPKGLFYYGLIQYNHNKLMIDKSPGFDIIRSREEGAIVRFNKLGWQKITFSKR